MESEKYTWLGKVCASIGEASDIGTSESYFSKSNVIRVAALESSYIFNKTQYTQEATGIYLPEGSVEYFKVNEGDEIVVKSGSVNISSVL